MKWGTLVLMACSAAPLQTVADGCYELAGVTCSKDVACTTGPGGSDCINAFQRVCCAEHDCAELVADCKAGLRECATPKGTALSSHVFRDCEAAVMAETCGQWANAMVPAACARDAG